MSHFSISDLKVDYRALCELCLLCDATKPTIPAHNMGLYKLIKAIWAFVCFLCWLISKKNVLTKKNVCAKMWMWSDEWMTLSAHNVRRTVGYLCRPAAATTHGHTTSLFYMACDQYHIQFSVFKAKQLSNVICYKMGTLARYLTIASIYFMFNKLLYLLSHY